MNTRTENLRKYNFVVGTDKQYRDNYDAVDKTITTNDKVFITANCKSCHIKVSTHNGKCPCCQKELNV